MLIHQQEIADISATVVCRTDLTTHTANLAWELIASDVCTPQKVCKRQPTFFSLVTLKSKRPSDEMARSWMWALGHVRSTVPSVSARIRYLSWLPVTRRRPAGQQDSVALQCAAQGQRPPGQQTATVLHCAAWRQLTAFSTVAGSAATGCQAGAPLQGRAAGGAANHQAAALLHSARPGLGTGLPQTPCTCWPGAALCDVHSLDSKHVTHTADMPQLARRCRGA